MDWRRLLQGRTQFSEGQEYTAFKYTFALAMLWITLLLLALFIAGDAMGGNQVGYHGYTIRGCFLLCAILIWMLRGHSERLRALVWVYSLIAGTYILLGAELEPPSPWPPWWPWGWRINI